MEQCPNQRSSTVPIEDDNGSKEKTGKKTEVYWAGVGGVSSGGASRVTPIVESYSSSW